MVPTRFARLRRARDQLRPTSRAATWARALTFFRRSRFGLSINGFGGLWLLIARPAATTTVAFTCAATVASTFAVAPAALAIIAR